MSFIIKKVKINKDVTIDSVSYLAGQEIEVVEGLISGEFVNEASLDQKNGTNSINFILLDDTEIIAADEINSMYRQYLAQTRGAEKNIYTKDITKAFFGSALSGGGGFIDYNDTSTSTTPISLVSDTWTTIPNDGLGAFTNKAYKPNGDVVELMDNSTGAIDPTGLKLGDTILIRNDFTVTPSTNNASLQFRYQLGAGAGSYTLEKRLGRLDEGSGSPYRFSLSPDLIYMGDTNTRDNPISLQVKLSTGGTLVNAGSVIQLISYKKV